MSRITALAACGVFGRLAVLGGLSGFSGFSGPRLPAELGLLFPLQNISDMTKVETSVVLCRFVCGEGRRRRGVGCAFDADS